MEVDKLIILTMAMLEVRGILNNMTKYVLMELVNTSRPVLSLNGMYMSTEAKHV